MGCRGFARRRRSLSGCARRRFGLVAIPLTVVFARATVKPVRQFLFLAVLFSSAALGFYAVFLEPLRAPPRVQARALWMRAHPRGIFIDGDRRFKIPGAVVVGENVLAYDTPHPRRGSTRFLPADAVLEICEARNVTRWDVPGRHWMFALRSGEWVFTDGVRPAPLRGK